MINDPRDLKFKQIKENVLLYQRLNDIYRKVSYIIF